MEKEQQINQNTDQKARICEFFVERKKRQCKFKAIQGSKFCASHCSDVDNKIECPYEKGTFIDANKFEKHMQNCPKIKQKQKMAQSLWYEKDINAKSEQVSQKKKIKVQQIEELSQVDPNKINQLLPRIIKLYTECYPGSLTQSYIESTQIQETPAEVTTNDHKQAYMLAESGYRHKLISAEVIYIEFGAGKGILSYAIAKKVEESLHKHSKNILLERQSRRNKFDKHFRSNPFFQRYKSDVSDFNMEKVDQIMIDYVKDKQTETQQILSRKQKSKKVAKQAKMVQKQMKNEELIEQKQQQLQGQYVFDLDFQKQSEQLKKCPIIGICKHMCGGALDISVRGLLKGKIGGVLLASCCHHLCSYQTYLNNSFFESFNLSPDQIQLLFKISSWGTKSTQIKFSNSGLDKEDQTFLLDESSIQKIAVKKVNELQLQEKIVIGRMCKRLIDKGRAQFLGGQVERYCSDQLTPQNFVIVMNKI